MSPHPRTPDELRQASNHLAYEWVMLKAVAEKLSLPDLDDVTRNAFIESFAVHARVLIEFLLHSGSRIKRTDRVVGEHFFSEPCLWYQKRALDKIRKPDEFDIDSRVGEQVVHLTYKRQEVTPEMKEWAITAIQEAINIAMETFLACVSDDLLGERWDDYKKQKLQYPVLAQCPYPAGLLLPKTMGGTAHPGTITNTVTPGVLRPPKLDELPK